jgi:hypothetical protein
MKLQGLEVKIVAHDKSFKLKVLTGINIYELVFVNDDWPGGLSVPYGI